MAQAVPVVKAKTQTDRLLKRKAQTLVLDAAPAVWAEIISLALGIKPATPSTRDRMLILLASRTLPELRSIEYHGDLGIRLSADDIMASLASVAQKHPELKLLPIFAKTESTDLESEADLQEGAS